jgi:REP element-mobilizing transposase RayT
LPLVLNYQDRIWFWEEGYHGEAIYTESFFLSKLKYLHENPVKAGLVESPEHYLYSSAGDYAGVRKGRIPIFGL